MITVVVGAQFGGEGKGKVAAYLACHDQPAVACRCGGPNSSHTVVWKGVRHRLRMMPTAAVVNPKIDVYFGAGTLIHPPTLFAEIKQIGYRGHLVIDPRTGVITEEIINAQRRDARYSKLGSTLTGTGYASALRCLRSLRLAKDSLETFTSQIKLADVSAALYQNIQRGNSILIEGHQGFGLSNYHGDYPFTSSRDSTSSSMLAEVGLGPRQDNLRIVLATKIFPTRNHAGHLDGELSPTEIRAWRIHEEGGGAWDIPNQSRRVGMFDFEIVERAIRANSATEIALTGADYLYANPRAQECLNELVAAIEKMASIPVRFISFGADTEQMIERRPTSRESRPSPVEPITLQNPFTLN